MARSADYEFEAECSVPGSVVVTLPDGVRVSVVVDMVEPTVRSGIGRALNTTRPADFAAPRPRGTAHRAPRWVPGTEAYRQEQARLDVELDEYMQGNDA